MHAKFFNSINYLPSVVTNKSEIIKHSEKCNFLTIQIYNDDWQWLYIDNLHAKKIKQKNNIIFFDRKFIYIAFFDEHIQL